MPTITTIVDRQLPTLTDIPTVTVTLRQGEAWVIYQAMLGTKDAALKAWRESKTEAQASLAEAKYNAAERVIQALTLAS